MFQYLLPGPHLYFEMVFVQLFFIAIIMKNMILLGSPFVFVVVTNDFSYPKIFPLPFLFSFPSLIKYHHSTNTVLLLLPLFNWSSSLKNCDKPFGKKPIKNVDLWTPTMFSVSNMIPLRLCWEKPASPLHEGRFRALRRARSACEKHCEKHCESTVKSTVCLWKLLWKDLCAC